MFAFRLVGELTGVKSTTGAVYLTIKPAHAVDWTRKGDRQASYNMQLSPAITLASLPPVGALVEVTGEGCRVYTDWIDPSNNRKKEIENYRYLLLTVKVMSAK